MPVPSEGTRWSQFSGRGLNGTIPIESTLVACLPKTSRTLIIMNKVDCVCVCVCLSYLICDSIIPALEVYYVGYSRAGATGHRFCVRRILLMWYHTPM